MARMNKTHRAAKTGRTAHFQLKLFWCRESVLPGREGSWCEFYTRMIRFENELRVADRNNRSVGIGHRLGVLTRGALCQSGAKAPHSKEVSMFPPPLKLVRKSFSIVVFLSFSLLTAIAVPISLEPGKPLERSIAPGETHSYTLNLNAGQYAHVVVDQRGVDVVTSVFAPDGTKLVQVAS